MNRRRTSHARVRVERQIGQPTGRARLVIDHLVFELRPEDLIELGEAVLRCLAAIERERTQQGGATP